MRLAIDIGNTRVKAGWREPDGPFDSRIIDTESDLRFLIDRGIDRAAIASVVPEKTSYFRALLESRGVASRELTAATVPGLRVLYESLETVGADRLANALFLSTGPLPAILVDFGTATKLDVVDASGAFLGGAILPSARMMAQALHRGTASLPEIALDVPVGAIGRTTRECLLSGTVLALTKAVDGLIDAIAEELNARPHVVSTGGAAGVVAPLTVHARTWEPQATLRGLLVAADRWAEAD